MASATAESSSIEANAAAAADARGRRPVWNVPPNDAIEVGPVMGAVSWPALSESARASPKSSSSESLKSLSDGSASASASATPGSPASSPSARPTDSPNISPIQKPTPPARQRSMRHGSGSSGISSGSSIPANGGVGPTLQHLVSVEIAQSAPEGKTVPEHSPRGSRTSGLSPQTHGASDQHRGYGGNRRGNNGGVSHHNHGNRRDQEWNHHRNAHMQHPQQHGRGGGGIRSYHRPPPPVSQLPLLDPLCLCGLLLGMHWDSMMCILVILSHHNHLLSLLGPCLLCRLQYHLCFFRSENLCKDLFLRQHMDDQGWVPISVIATFNRVQQLTNSIQYILDTVKLSTVVEVQEEEEEKKIRRRNNWKNWLLLPSSHLGSTSGRQSLTTSDYDAVTTRLQSMSLEGATANHIGMRGPIRADLVLTRSAYGHLNNQFQVVGGPVRNGSGQFSGFNDSDRFLSSRSLSRSDTL